MAKRFPVSPSRRALLVVALSGLVYCPASDSRAQARKKQPASGKTAPAPRAEAALPPGVVEMRDAILAAVHSGLVEDLRYAIELNELRPELEASSGTDPIAHFRAISGDGEGREVLANLGKLLDTPFTTLPVGRDLENNRLYVWPQLSEFPPASLTPGQQVELLRLVSPAEAKAMRDANRWLWWRLVIGADGTWHAFVKGR